jgi:hypothetical protein
MRKSYGPFKSVDDLRASNGIGPKRMDSPSRGQYARPAASAVRDPELSKGTPFYNS